VQNKTKQKLRQLGLGESHVIAVNADSTVLEALSLMSMLFTFIYIGKKERVLIVVENRQTWCFFCGCIGPHGHGFR
jgi:hypothetical protein